MFRIINRRISTLAIMGLLPAALMFGQVNTKQIALEKEGTQLIGQLEDVARDISYNAEQLDTLSHRSQVSPWTHAHHLHQIRTLVNEGLRPALKRLTEIQPQLPSWKQDAIDQMLSSAQALAADTNSAIISKKEAGSKPALMNAEYRDLLGKMKGHAEVLVKTSDAAEQLASAHLKAAEAGLDLSTR